MEPSKLSRRDLGRLTCLGLLPVNGACQNRRYSQMLPTLFACDEQQLRMIASSAAAERLSPDELKRNASGDCAYLEMPSPSSELLVIPAKGDPRRLKLPGFFWGVSDDLKFLAWREGDGLRFHSGEFHEIPRLGMPLSADGQNVGFAPGGAHYFVSSGTTTEIFATSAPAQRIAVAGFFARNMFYGAERLFIFGDEISSDDYVRSIVGEMYTVAAGALRPRKSIRILRPRPLPGPFVVLDMDLDSKTVLCIDQRDFYGPDWLLYDLSSGSLRHLGPAQTFGVFLVPSLVKALYDRLGSTK